jgi:hypothetical protein
MTEEQIKLKAEEYTKNVVSSFKQVARKAYMDGMRDALQVIYEMIETEGYRNGTNIGDDDY